MVISKIRILLFLLHIGLFSESDQAPISKKEPALHIDGSCETKQKFNEISNHLDAHIHNGASSQFIFIFSNKHFNFPRLLISYYDYR